VRSGRSGCSRRLVLPYSAHEPAQMASGVGRLRIAATPDTRGFRVMIKRTEDTS
jgi:hypothetical protein